jgi:hypothetical protein
VVVTIRVSHQTQTLDRFGLFWCRIPVQNYPMIRQDKLSWNKGRADAMRGAPSKCPKGLDALSYASGYIEGQARRAKRPLRVITSPKVSKDAP